MMKGLVATLLSVLSAVCLATTPVAAQGWPTRPVRIVAPFAAGGAADIMARLVADHLSTAFGQQFVVENRGGAAGTIGLRSVVSAEPDGYTFVLTAFSLLVITPATNPNVGYDPIRSLTNVAYIAGSPIMLTVNRVHGPKTLQDLIALGKKNAKPLTYSSAGIGSNGQLVAESFAREAGIRIEHVSYKGVSQGLMDLVGNHIDFAVQSVASSAGQVRGGFLRPLAQTAPERLPDYPDVSTFKELGYDLVTANWFGLAGPAKLPPDIVTKVNREVVAMLDKPEVQQRLRRDGLQGQRMTAAQFGKFIEAETERWTPVIKKIGISAK